MSRGTSGGQSWKSMLKMERFCREGHQEGRVGSPCLIWIDYVERDIRRAELEVHA